MGLDYGGLVKVVSGAVRYGEASKALNALPEYQQHSVNREVDSVNTELRRRFDDPYNMTDDAAYDQDKASAQLKEESGHGGSAAGVLSAGGSATGVAAAAARAGQGAMKKASYLSAIANLSKIYQDVGIKNTEDSNARLLRAEQELGKAASDGFQDAEEGGANVVSFMTSNTGGGGGGIGGFGG